MQSQLIAGIILGVAISSVLWLFYLGAAMRTLSKAIEFVDEDAECAYVSGVEDGYGYATDRWNRDYQAAGEWLKANAKDKFPELQDDEE